MDIRDGLKELGFFSVVESLSVLKAQARTMVQLAGTDTNELKFEALASYIPAKRAKYPHDSQLVIDIGGTSTKTGIRLCDQSGFEHWHLLFELSNSDLQHDEDSDLPLASFAFHLGEHLIDNLKRIGVNYHSISTCAIVWSNAMVNKRLDNNRGITGFVVQREKYNKGEWFIDGLEDGTDLGTLFLDGFARNGLNIKTFIIANDTPLTMKALPEAHGGVVASTGLNGTIVKSFKELDLEDKSGSTVICNGEMGGRFVLDQSLLSRADLVGTAEPANTIEFLCAGRFVPRLFAAHIIELAAIGCTELRPLSESLLQKGEERWSVFRAKDMGLLLSDPQQFLSRRENPALYTTPVLSALSLLSSEIFVRSARLCSVVAYGTISNRLPDLDKAIVALDSRLAREVPLFKETFTAQLQAIADDEETVITCPLIRPLEVEGGKVSVPMQGAAHALDCLT